MVAALLADLFESHRPHLLSVGYRLTGSVTDAEDAVQESWLRLAVARQHEIEDLRAWLTTVVSRICLDRLRSAATRRERYVGQWLPEPVVTSPLPSSTPDPLAAVVRKQDARLAALVVLDTLTPPQRVAFVLHDGFSVPFDEIGDILGVSTDAARQLAVRARKAAARAPEPVTDDEHNAAVQALLEALYRGDVDAVVAALHPEIHTVGDAGGTTATAINVVAGVEKNARLWLGLRRKYGLDDVSQIGAGEFEFVLVNGQLGMLIHERAPRDGIPGSPLRVYAFTVRDGKIWSIYDLVNPAKLTGIRLPR
ncbi:RNA polymerase sigma factor SigJ [Nocardia huaxiensis]|uniref:RNA polymerase sigma factor SigJ n=1 Tax=Nocardia huaxiensis TaxID=2755382 RepID=A0A7D6VFA7_9NOCA|nr:RNA polymerase sigma factor SigJ [Nocardia huaxiensis]QLY31637.1 RNA polymerase sigma factor SigJ [Nocardia huaxiensis]UFS95190.1 RNA polymerase sigma factor SigJ [Nocardia huaxiensis]